MAAHRRYRLFIDASNHTSYAGIKTIELRTVAGVTEIPSGGVASASGIYNGSYSADKALDTTTSYWCSNSGGNNDSWWEYDYGEGNEVEIVEYAITACSTPSYSPKTFALQYSDDGIEWINYSNPPADQTGWSTNEQRVFAVDIPLPQTTRVTQFPVFVIDKASQAARISQFPILLIALPAQPTRVTQAAVLVPIEEPDTPVASPFLAIPDDSVVEELVWLTSVVISDNGTEQRAALRASPRRRFKFDAIFLTEEERRQYIDILKQHQDIYVDWPVWVYNANLEPAASGSTELKFNPASTDLRAGEKAAIYDSHSEQVHAVTIDTVDADGCTLSAPVDFEITRACSICPMLRMRVQEQGQLDTDGISGSMSLSLEFVDDRVFTRVSGTSMLTIYDGEIILDKPQIISTTDKYDKSVTWVDNDIAIPLSFTHFKNTFMGGGRVFKFLRYGGGLDYVRALFDTIKGQQGTFRIPTFFDDLPLVAQPALGATTLVTTNVQFEKYLYTPVNKMVRIESQAGVVYRRITGFERVFDEAGNPVALSFNLNSSIGAGAGANIIKRISICPLARLNSDVVKLTHTELETQVSVDIRTVDA